MFSLMQRALVALCFLFLTGCSTPTCRQWEIQEILTKRPCFNAGRLLLVPDNDRSYLELELARNQYGIHLYLNLLLMQAPPCEDDSLKTQIQICFDDAEPWIVYPYLFNGGQRLLLPNEVTDYLIQALLDERSFKIQIGRSYIQVISKNFQPMYERLLALPITDHQSR